MQHSRELHGISVSHYMHIHSKGFIAKQVVMKSSDLDAVFLQFLHHRIHFGSQENKITHYHSLRTHFGKREVRAKGERWLNLYSIK